MPNTPHLAPGADLPSATANNENIVAPTPTPVAQQMTAAPATAAQDAGNPQDQAHLQIDDQRNSGDDDSAYGSSLASSSVSLESSIEHYKYENGRRYHAFKEGEYILPNDETEQARLDLQHHIYRLCLGGKLFEAPIKHPQAVLDIGTGTGIWAIHFADEYPGPLVIGTDLSPIQPRWVAPNVKFYIDDFESPWEFPEIGKFDFIHWRSLSGSTGKFPKLYAQALNELKVGAYLEVQEYDAWVYSDDDPELKNAPNTLEWCQTLNKVSQQFGKVLNVGRFHKKWMQDAGFVDVVERVEKVPIGPWTRNLAKKEMGRFERMHMNDSVEAHSMALYTRVLNHTEAQAKVIFERVKAEFNDKNLHLYTVYRFLHGRRPAA